MTIDKEQLISLLTDKTGQEREQVESQLAELISRIQQAADDGKTFEIAGFGTFGMDDGQLQFTPADTLETEINNKYAGMKPIELIGAFKEPTGEEIPDMDRPQQNDEDKVWAFDEDAVDEEEPATNPAAEADTESETDEADPERDDEQLKPATADGSGTGVPDVEIDEDTSQKDIVEPVEAEKQGQVAEQSTEESEKQGEEATEPVTADTGESNDPIGRFLVAAVLVLAVGIGGWLIYDTGLLSGGSQNGPPVTSSTEGGSNQELAQSGLPAQPASDSVDDSASTQSSSSADDENRSEPEQDLQVIKQAGQDDDQQPFGLHGAINDSVDGYTIVVHSLQQMDKADRRRQNLQQAGFRALVNQADVNGTTYYRVGLGQFESVQAAQQAVDKIPEEYRNNNFIKRIK